MNENDDRNESHSEGETWGKSASYTECITETQGECITETQGEWISDTARQTRAIFERQGGASRASTRGSDGAARTGGAARHAGPSVESTRAGSSGMTRWGAARLANRSRPVSWA